MGGWLAGKVEVGMGGGVEEGVSFFNKKNVFVPPLSPALESVDSEGGEGGDEKY